MAKVGGFGGDGETRPGPPEMTRSPWAWIRPTICMAGAATCRCPAEEKSVSWERGKSGEVRQIENYPSTSFTNAFLGASSPMVFMSLWTDALMCSRSDL
jgi:hypothetical protein